MKFYNAVTSIDLINRDYLVLDNSNKTQAALVITIQLINNSPTDISVEFKRKKYDVQNKTWVSTPYTSVINIKSGTTILDHIVVINEQQGYFVSSNSNKLIVSCSYGI